MWTYFIDLSYQNYRKSRKQVEEGKSGILKLPEGREIKNDKSD